MTDTTSTFYIREGFVYWATHRAVPTMGRAKAEEIFDTWLDDIEAEDMQIGIDKGWAAGHEQGYNDARGVVEVVLDGIDRVEPEEGAWWETSSGAEFGAGRLALIRAFARGQEGTP